MGVFPIRAHVHYCPKMSTLAVLSVDSVKYCAVETRYKISDVFPKVALNLPVLASVKEVVPAAWT
jgi:hypothetical protein